MQGCMISTSVNENEIGETCGMYGGEEMYDQCFGGETRVKETCRDT
jgi:hypothetical protein